MGKENVYFTGMQRIVFDSFLRMAILHLNEYFYSMKYRLELVKK